MIAEREFLGRCPVWRVDYAGTNETDAGSVTLAADSPRQMLDAWIPPYVLREAERISFEIFPLEGAAHVAFLGADLGFENLGKQVWRTITRPCGTDAFGLLRGLAFRMRGAGRANFLFAEMRIHLKDGRTYEVLHERAPRYTDMMAAPLVTAPARPLPSRPRIQFGAANLTCLELAPRWPEIARFMAKYLPEYDIVLSAGGTPPRSTAR